MAPRVDTQERNAGVQRYSDSIDPPLRTAGRAATTGKPPRSSAGDAQASRRSAGGRAAPLRFLADNTRPGNAPTPGRIAATRFNLQLPAHWLHRADEARGSVIQGTMSPG